MWRGEKKVKDRESESWQRFLGRPKEPVERKSWSVIEVTGFGLHGVQSCLSLKYSLIYEFLFPGIISETAVSVSKIFDYSVFYTNVRSKIPFHYLLSQIQPTGNSPRKSSLHTAIHIRHSHWSCFAVVL